MNTKNIFVLGMTDLQRTELETTRGAQDYRFHGLLDYEQLVDEADYDLDVLLDRARHQLDQFTGDVDAIVCHWDFPSSIIGPILSAERDLPAPSLESLLTCEHKLWSRPAQREVVPEVVPAFVATDHKLLEDPGDHTSDHPVPLSSPLSVGMFAGKWASYSAVPDLPYDQREEDGGALVFQGEPLEEPLEIFGLPTFVARVSADPWPSSRCV